MHVSFRQESFDKHIIREAAGDLLCGVYDEQLYEAENRIAELNKAALVVPAWRPDRSFDQQVHTGRFLFVGDNTNKGRVKYGMF